MNSIVSEPLTSLEEKLSKVADFVEKYRSVGDVHLVEFITCNLWDGLIPDKIQQECLNMNNSEWYKYLKNTRQIQRDVLSDDNSLENYILEAMTNELRSLNVLTDINEIFTQEHNFFLKKSVKEKKRIEVNCFSKLINAVAKKHHIENIIDIGSGKGYLSSYLSLNYSFNVLGIDSQQICCESAALRDAKLKKCWKSLTKREKAAVATNETSGTFVSTTHFVEENSNIFEIWKERTGICTDENVLLVGLHTCGDLASKMIALFLNNEKIRALINVACCYHHIEEEFVSSPFKKQDDPLSNYRGFPLSNVLRGRKFFLGRKMRMLASESLDRLIEYERTMNPTLFYRSLLQLVLRDKFAIYDHVKVGRIEQKDLNFLKYCRTSIERLNLDNSKVSDEELENYQRNHQHLYSKFETLYRIRALLAPVIEGLIVLDRFCYLHQQNSNLELIFTQVFNPVQSPRCCCVIAIKR